MFTLNSIVAMTENRTIAINGIIPFRYKQDLQRFKQLTINKTVVMGYKTYLSIGKYLPNRTNFVLSRTVTEIPGCTVFKDAPTMISNFSGDIWNIGGGEIYRLLLPYTQGISITYVPDKIQNNSTEILFPELDDNWSLISEVKDPIPDTDESLRHCYYNNRLLSSVLAHTNH